MTLGKVVRVVSCLVGTNTGGSCPGVVCRGYSLLGGGVVVRTKLSKR